MKAKKKRCWFVHLCVLSVVTLGALAACNSGGGGGRKDPAEPAFSPLLFADNSADITNPWLPLEPGRIIVLEGMTDEGEFETVEIFVSHVTRDVNGVECRIVVDRVYDEDGELIEETFDWFAQDIAGNVWYFGEDTAEYDGGVFVGTDGAWEAGVDGAEAGILIKATPRVGDSYRQEYYAGEAEDMAQVVALNVTVTLTDGTQYSCLQTEEWTPLEPGAREYKFYARNIGLIREQDIAGTEYLELAEFGLDTMPDIDPADFVATIDNPFFPLTPGTTFNYEKMTDEGLETVETFVSFQTRVVMGVTCIVVEDREYLDGDLTEETFDWYAQDDDGNVWYFGEDSTAFENGVAVGTDGSWEAGVDGAQPGIIMLADPRIGDSYRQEYYAGEAEDFAVIDDLATSVVVPAGSFSGCLRTLEWNALEEDSNEYKYYAAGVGLLVEEDDEGERLELISITP